MEQDSTGLNDATDMPGKAADIPTNLPNDINEPESAEFAADLMREETIEPVPLEPTALNQGEDTVWLVETIEDPEFVEIIMPTDEVLMGADAPDVDMNITPGPHLEEGKPWYQSRWVYLGAGLVVATTATLGIGSYVLIRNRNRRNHGLNVTRRVADSFEQVRLQTGALTQGRLSQLTNQLGSQIGKFSEQAQSQWSRFASAKQGTGNLKPLQQQMTVQAGEQLRSLGATTKAITASAVSKAQDGLSQVRESAATSAAMAKSGLKHTWKLGRNFTLGAAAGMLWSYLYAPQDGETTRKRLKKMLPPQLRNE